MSSVSYPSQKIYYSAHDIKVNISAWNSSFETINHMPESFSQATECTQSWGLRKHGQPLIFCQATLQPEEWNLLGNA